MGLIWLARKLVANNSSNTISTGVMDDYQVIHQYTDKNMQFLSPYGYQSNPQKGTNLLILDSGQGSKICAGTTTTTDVSLKTGEIKIIASSGAYIKLDKNGNVIINGLLITKDGRIQEVIQ